MRKIYIILLLLSILPLRVAAQEADTTALKESPALTPAELWDAANTAYLRSDYREAIRTYEAILARDLHSVKLYYNLAGAYFKDGRLGEAILYYHRALQLDPSDEDIRHNLKVAEQHTVDRIDRIPEFFLKSWGRTLRTTLSGTAWTILSLVLLALSLGSLLLYLLSQRISLRKAGFFGTLAGLLLFVAATSFAAASRREVVDKHKAVVLSTAVSVKSSPDKAATDLFVIHEGTTLTLGEELGDWQEVKLSDGKKGWLERRHIEAI